MCSSQAGDGWDVTAVPPPEQLQAAADGTLGSLWDEGNLLPAPAVTLMPKELGRTKENDNFSLSKTLLGVVFVGLGFVGFDFP